MEKETNNYQHLLTKIRSFHLGFAKECEDEHLEKYQQTVLEEHLLTQGTTAQSFPELTDKTWDPFL